MGRLSDADAEQIADEVGDGQSGRATEHHLITASRGELPPIRALLAPVRTSVGSTAMKVLGVEDVALSAASRRPAAELAVVSRLFVRPGARGRQLGEGLIRTTSQFWVESRIWACARGREGTAVGRHSAVRAAGLSAGWATPPAEWTTPSGDRPQLCLYLLGTTSPCA